MNKQNMHMYTPMESMTSSEERKKKEKKEFLGIQ